MSNFLIVWCVLIHVKHYKFKAGRERLRMKDEKQRVQKLVAGKHKTAEELAHEEYQRQLEMAIENH